MYGSLKVEFFFAQKKKIKNPWVFVGIKIPVDYPYRDTRADMGTGTGTIFIQRGGDRYHTTCTRRYPLTSLLIASGL